MYDKTRKAYTDMLARCNNPNHPSAYYYSHAGIIYDPRWEIYNNFLEDMGEAPVGRWLDRIDGTKNYCKDNCRWATTAEQGRNRKGVKLVVEQVIQIKKLLRETKCRVGRQCLHEQLGKQFNVTRHCIKNIDYNETWKDVICE